MQFDDPLVHQHCREEIEGCWKFIEEQLGVPYSEEQLIKYTESFNKLTEFEHEKWEVAGKTDFYPINGVAQALYRIYYSQDGDRPIWHEVDGHVRKILTKCVKNKINPYPNTTHRVIAWSCAPLYYSNWCTWAYNCWGLNCIINMDSLMFDIVLRTDSHEHLMEDLVTYNEWAPMRRMPSSTPSTVTPELLMTLPAFVSFSASVVINVLLTVCCTAVLALSVILGAIMFFFSLA